MRPGLLRSHFLFIVVLLASILPIWMNTYFLTGDGPCHVYNAAVLSDIIERYDFGFFNPYYYINEHIQPNEFTHFTLIVLNQLCAPIYAEKIFITLYMVLFVYGFKYLAESIHKQNGFLALLIVPFIYQRVFIMGFYNYVYSITFSFWIIGYWLQHRRTLSYTGLCLMSICFVVLYLMHLSGFFFTVCVLGCITIADAITLWKTGEGIRAVIHIFARLLLTLLPSVTLLVGTYVYSGASPLVSVPGDKISLLLRLVTLHSLYTLAAGDVPLSILFGALLCALFLYGIWVRIKKPADSISNVFLLLTVCVCAAYFMFYENIAGGGVLRPRLEVLFYLCMILWLASLTHSTVIRRGIIILSIMFSMAFIIVKIPVLKELSAAETEYLSAATYIPDKSVVLPLSYCHNGMSVDGQLIAKNMYLFYHAADYMGAYKHLILLDNYEASTYYFPLIWREKINPFIHLGVKNSIEGSPPMADIQNYNYTCAPIDYVVIWNFNIADKTDPDVQYMVEQLDAGYDLIYTSVNKRSVLYRRKGRL